MKINEELVDIYNRKYWTVLNEDNIINHWILIYIPFLLWRIR